MSTWPPEANAASNFRPPARLPRMTFSMLPAMRPKSALASSALMDDALAFDAAITWGEPAPPGALGLRQAPLADGLREGEDRARERRAVLLRAHHGIGHQHLDAARPHVG